MSPRRLIGVLCVVVLAVAAAPAAQGSRANTAGAISESDLRAFLTFIASDALEGRATYSEGLGLAAQYIAQHLKEWGVEPGGDRGTYFQQVPNHTVRVARNSALTVTITGETRTFKDGADFLLPANQGIRQTMTIEGVIQGGDDLTGLDLKKKVVLLAPPANARGRDRRAQQAIAAGAAMVFGPARFTAGPGPAGSPMNEFTAVAMPSASIAPIASASDELAAFLRKGLSAPATITLDIAPQYDIVRTQFSRNVIGIVRGTDAALRDTYVGFGAHYDHVGVLSGAPRATGSPGNPRIRKDDRIFNGADDDGSGTVALMSIAKAFALGPKPKRSLMFVWHTGEEGGLRGSRFNADAVDPQKMVAVLNMDMIGRNFEDKAEHANHLFIVGSDRISTELHNVNEDANTAMAKPLTFDYAMNDPADPESIYTRSDHYSYAAKGIPVIFYFAGLHPDYHQVSDEIDAINWDKLTRIARLVHDTGMRVGNMAQPPARDNKGPRAGRGFTGKLR